MSLLRARGSERHLRDHAGLEVARAREAGEDDLLQLPHGLEGHRGLIDAGEAAARHDGLLRDHLDGAATVDDEAVDGAGVAVADVDLAADDADVGHAADAVELLLANPRALAGADRGAEAALLDEAVDVGDVAGGDAADLDRARDATRAERVLETAHEHGADAGHAHDGAEAALVREDEHLVRARELLADVVADEAEHVIAVREVDGGRLVQRREAEQEVARVEVDVVLDGGGERLAVDAAEVALRDDRASALVALQEVDADAGDDAATADVEPALGHDVSGVDGLEAAVAVGADGANRIEVAEAAEEAQEAGGVERTHGVIPISCLCPMGRRHV